ncbi:hypothetical protein JCM15519_33380 [Fundidesulfovibrio butyratiphilus]
MLRGKRRLAAVVRGAEGGKCGGMVSQTVSRKGSCYALIGLSRPVHGTLKTNYVAINSCFMFSMARHKQYGSPREKSTQRRVGMPRWRTGEVCPTDTTFI